MQATLCDWDVLARLLHDQRVILVELVLHLDIAGRLLAEQLPLPRLLDLVAKGGGLQTHPVHHAGERRDGFPKHLRRHREEAVRQANRRHTTLNPCPHTRTRSTYSVDAGSS